MKMYLLQFMNGFFFYQFLKRLGDILMPRECITCGRTLLFHEEHLCIWCIDDLPLTYFWLQPRNEMADRFNERIQQYIESSEGKFEPYSYAVALFYYSSFTGYSKITQSLKYYANLSAGRYFSSILAQKLEHSKWLQDIDAFVPVPLHWTRLWTRGYNQAEIIAESLAKGFKAQVIPNLLKRTRRTTSQTRLDAQQRSSNVSGAFCVNSKVMDRLLKQNIRHVALVDDVFTTGATLMACYTELKIWLKAKGINTEAFRISIITLGFVG